MIIAASVLILAVTFVFMMRYLMLLEKQVERKANEHAEYMRELAMAIEGLSCEVYNLSFYIRNHQNQIVELDETAQNLSLVMSELLPK